MLEIGTIAAGSAAEKSTFGTEKLLKSIEYLGNWGGERPRGRAPTGKGSMGPPRSGRAVRFSVGDPESSLPVGARGTVPLELRIIIMAAAF